MRLLLVSALLLTACNFQQADKDLRAIGTQGEHDVRFVAGETAANLGQVVDNIDRSTSRMADNTRNQIKRTNRKLRDWWLTPLPEPQPSEIASSYCYRVFQDIVCYREPMAGWEHRLVAYQGTHAAPPPAAVTEPLPVIDVDPAKLQAARISNARPVFVALPPEEEKKVQSSDGVVVIDESRESLPNPALVPQL
ncbi:MAG: hypothetical protein SFW63_05970 [Alphaproteobacteria bacterium]|nr:hypothetical protein [Alphaproteobacteria bacterium]